MEGEKILSISKRKGRLAFGEVGHESEYIFIMHNEKDDRKLPDIIANLQQRLGDDWEVLNRGSRIEISHKIHFGFRDDSLIENTLDSVFAEITF